MDIKSGFYYKFLISSFGTLMAIGTFSPPAFSQQSLYDNVAFTNDKVSFENSINYAEKELQTSCPGDLC